MWLNPSNAERHNLARWASTIIAASSTTYPTTRKAVALLLLVLTLGATSTGCVERRMTIRSNPPGALVYVDDQPEPIGVTPVSHDFIYYGTRKFRLVKDGYETLTVKQSIPTPWYQYVPFDFITENFVPGQIHDQRCMDFQLRPQVVVPTDQLMARAEELRRGVHATAGVPVGMPPAGPVNGQPVGPVNGQAVGPMNGPVVGTPAPGPEVVPAPQGTWGVPVQQLPPRQ